MAVKVAEAEPGDAVAALDVAELSLQLGRHDDAVAAFARVRSIDDLPDHDVYALHGMIGAEVDRERWDRARELASEAAATDSPRPDRDRACLPRRPGRRARANRRRRRARTWTWCCATSLAEHRRAHAEDERPGPEERGWLTSPTPRPAGVGRVAPLPRCETFIYHKRLRRNLGVCPSATTTSG